MSKFYQKGSATETPFDNTGTGLVADNVQLAVGELLGFKSVSDMKTSLVPLVAGRTIKTRSYYLDVVGGAASYIVLTAASYAATPDGFVDHYLGGGTDFVAKFSPEESRINILQAGVKGDKSRSYSPEMEAAKVVAEANRWIYDLDNIEVLIDQKLSFAATTAIESGGHSTIQGVVGYNGDGIEVLPGNNTRKMFGTIDRFVGGDGLNIRSNVGFTQFRTISNCNAGLVFSSINHSVLDAEVVGTQIGICNQGVTFRSNNSANVMQGSKATVNFISVCTESVVFDDEGTHSSISDWDSNEVICAAIDPITTGSGGSVLINKSSFDVQRFTFNVTSWLGGLDTGAKLIKGKFLNLNTRLSFAQAMTMDRIDVTSIASIASANIHLRGGSNFGAGVTAYTPTITTGLIADFNGGVPFYKGNNALKVILPSTLAPGQKTNGAQAFHFLSKSSNIPFFDLRVLSSNKSMMLHVAPVGNEADGMLRITIINIGDVNINSGEEILCNLSVQY
jgi:hypothetical protein